MRVKIVFAYNGTHFLGSQTQTETSNTVLGTIERVLLKLGIKERLIASGRTDKGVHATAQVCHLDLPPYWSNLEKLKKVLNDTLVSSIIVRHIQEVSEDFHARYSAVKRSYRYLIKEGDSNPFESDFITFKKEINFDILSQNITLFQGEHDFVYFMKTGSDTGSTHRYIYNAYAYRHKEYIILHFQANGFLRSQIRLMVGALFTLSATEIQEKLRVKKNHKCRPAPANGLYLAKILY